MILQLLELFRRLIKEKNQTIFVLDYADGSEANDVSPSVRTRPRSLLIGGSNTENKHRQQIRIIRCYKNLQIYE